MLLTYCRKTALNYTAIFTQLAVLLQLKFTVYHCVIVHSCNFLRHCPLLQLPPSMSSPAMSIPVFFHALSMSTPAISVNPGQLSNMF